MWRHEKNNKRATTLTDLILLASYGRVARSPVVWLLVLAEDCLEDMFNESCDCFVPRRKAVGTKAAAP